MQVDVNVGQKMSQDVKEGITIDISTNGVLFKSGHKPNLGKMCKLEILLPQEEDIVAIGKITKVNELNASEDTIYEVGVEFTQITKLNIDKICMWYYKSQLIPDFDHGSVEHRKSKRLKVKQAWLKYRKKRLLRWDDWNISPIFNIAPHGILFQAKEKFKVNEILLVEMHFSAYDKPIKALGKVVRVRRCQLDYMNEVAIVLSKLSKDDKKRLEEPIYLESLTGLCT